MKLDEYTTEQLVIELICRIKLTNGIEFCTQEQIGELLDLLLEVTDG